MQSFRRGLNSEGIQAPLGTSLTKEDNGAETPGWIFAHRSERQNKLFAEGRRSWRARFQQRFQVSLGCLLKGALKLHQSAAARDGDCFRAAQNIQLGEDVAQMPLHRGFADEEIRADFLVAFAARQ